MQDIEAKPPETAGVAAPGEGSRGTPPAPTVRDIDIIYQETDRLYYRLARGCGLSDAAYWIMYDLELAGGRVSQRSLGEAHSLSPQTVNSAIKSLESRGLVRLELEEGSRKRKDVLLTEAGHAFCQEKIEPAIQAEARAFDALSPADRREFVRLVRAYADAIESEFRSLFGDASPDKAQKRGGDA